MTRKVTVVLDEEDNGQSYRGQLFIHPNTRDLFVLQWIPPAKMYVTVRVNGSGLWNFGEFREDATKELHKVPMGAKIVLEVE